MAILVLTIMGDDRPGLVDAVAGAVAAHDGNWEQSSMAQLANKFAGILKVNVAEERVDALTAALRELATGGLQVMVERADEDRVDEQRRLRLELVGQDHPGIVRDISHALALRGISIEELETETRSASMAGGTLFYAEATLLAPQAMPLHELESALEALANELMVDVEVAEAP
jgi:glycine cleavage system regulatory protein